LPKIKAKIHLNKGEIFDHKDNDQALEWLQLGLKTLGDIKDKSKEVYDIEMALNVKMGSIYIAKGNYDAAAQFSQAGLSLSSNIANRRQAIAHLNLGDVYYHKGDIRRSIEETQRSIDICKQIDDQYWLVSGLINLGVLCFQMNEHMEALHIMEERLPPMLERLDSIKMRTYYGLNFGYMYFRVIWNKRSF